MRIMDWSSYVCSSDLFGRDTEIVEALPAALHSIASRATLQVRQKLRAGGGNCFGVTPDKRLSFGDLVARGHVGNLLNESQIGRASSRERVCQYVSVSVGAVSITKKKYSTTNTK